MKASRWFAIKLTPLFVVTGFLLYRQIPWLGQMVWVLGAGLITWGILFPTHLLPLQNQFHRLGQFLRNLMSRVLLEGLYSLVLTPLSWFAKRLGKEFLDLKISPEATSYFIRRKNDPTAPNDYEKGY